MKQQIIEEVILMSDEYDSVEDMCEALTDYVSSIDINPAMYSEYEYIFESCIDGFEDGEVELYAQKVIKKIKKLKYQSVEIDREAKYIADNLGG